MIRIDRIRHEARILTGMGTGQQVTDSLIREAILKVDGVPPTTGQVESVCRSLGIELQIDGTVIVNG